MPEASGTVYEVTHSVDREIIDDFDAWLGQHVSEMLEIPGIIDAAVFAADDDAEGRPQRVTQYFFPSDVELEQYLAGPANDMRKAADDLFGGRFEVNRRVLHETELIGAKLKPLEACLNCGTTLGGQYCGNCGQRARSRLISIWELLQEAFGDLFEIDSRLWRTLIPLAIKPGKLTRDYLEGRRARFMPPFRTYLVLSIFFFLVAFFDPRQEFSIFFEPEPDAPEEAQEEAQDEESVREEVARELAEEGIIVPGPEDEEEDGFSITFDDEDAGADCDIGDWNEDEIPPWLASRLTKERIELICERIRADEGQAWITKLLDNVPAGLFILLPLMALILKVLYPLSKRYYVEHLLFVVHFHAFVFLILTLQIAFSRTASMVNLPATAADVTVFAVSLYIPVYLYKAMRRVYEQGRFVTILKYLTLLLAYFVGLASILVFAALFAAFSI